MPPKRSDAPPSRCGVSHSSDDSSPEQAPHAADKKQRTALSAPSAASASRVTAPGRSIAAPHSRFPAVAEALRAIKNAWPTFSLAPTKASTSRGNIQMANVTYPCYWQKKDTRGQWYWIYYASNGEEIARSSESYVRREDCERSMEIMQSSSSNPVFYSE
jgi:uncharacterized protein YegP (UPF0339 family)